MVRRGHRGTVYSVNIRTMVVVSAMISWTWFIPAVLSFRTDDSAVAEGLHLVESAILNTLFSSTPGVVYSGGRKLTTSGLVLISGFIVYFSLPHILVVFLLTYLLNSGATFAAETLNFDVLHMRHAYTHTYTIPWLLSTSKPRRFLVFDPSES